MGALKDSGREMTDIVLSIRLSNDGKAVSIEKLEGLMTCSGLAMILANDSPPDKPASKPGAKDGPMDTPTAEPADPATAPIDGASTLMFFLCHPELVSGSNGDDYNIEKLIVLDVNLTEIRTI